MEYTIEITQYCQNDCPYCSSDATNKGKHLPLVDILEFLQRNKINQEDRINISGGEPLAHPNFYHILQSCLTRTSSVWVYTNALAKIKYNAQVLTDGIEVEANYCLYPGCFEQPVKINEGTKINMLQFVPTGRGKGLRPQEVHVSGNITGNCVSCEHVLLQANGKIVGAPCKKDY